MPQVNKPNKVFQFQKKLFLQNNFVFWKIYWNAGCQLAALNYQTLGMYVYIRVCIKLTLLS